MSVKITDKDRGAAEMIARMIAHGALSFGVLGAEGDQPAEQHNGGKSTITVSEVAAIHEFGLGSAPRRSFLADWADEKKAEIQNVVMRGGAALARGRISSPKQLLEQIGQWAVGSIQARMATNIPPPLAPATIKRKGSSVALIDTGQLRSSITYRVDEVEANKVHFGGPA